MKIVEIATDTHGLNACAELMRAAFPTTSKLNPDYLNWLYVTNPAGPVVGYNAWEGSTLIGHYACIPVELYLDGISQRGLLALNTAMHPEYRNAGIIYSLARKTCKLAAEQAFSCIYAVANAASTPIFTQALRFQFICPLTASLGVGGLQPDWERALQGNRFRRKWTDTSIRWRAGNPGNHAYLQKKPAGITQFQVKTHIPRIFAYGLMPTEADYPLKEASPGAGINLYLGLLPEKSCRYPGYFPVPERLKPSPLNFIYLPLSDDAPQQLTRDEIILGFHDFDPY